MTETWSTIAATLAVPVGFAVFIWWFSTGLILLLDHLPRTGVRWSIVASSVVALAAFAGLAHTADLDSATGAYCAFTSTLLIWGWHELSFLSGWLTGPRRHALADGTRGWPRLVESVRAILWHEIGLIATGALIVALTWDRANAVGAWTFAVLWTMRTSAKFNLFLGVRNLSEAFLPPHLKYLQSFFRRRAMNGLFPFVVTASTVVLVVMVQQAIAPGVSDGTRVGLLLVGALLALAIVEHWLLVLPIEATALWRWALRRQGAEPPPPEAEETLLHAR
jgi:putative photosynthetic complex assembly protein 2